MSKHTGAPDGMPTAEQIEQAKASFLNMFGGTIAAAQQAATGQAPAVEVQVPLYAKIALGVVAASAVVLAVSSLRK